MLKRSQRRNSLSFPLQSDSNCCGDKAAAAAATLAPSFTLKLRGRAALAVCRLRGLRCVWWCGEFVPCDRVHPAVGHGWCTVTFCIQNRQSRTEDTNLTVTHRKSHRRLGPHPESDDDVVRSMNCLLMKQPLLLLPPPPPSDRRLLHACMIHDLKLPDCHCTLPVQTKCRD